MFKVSTNFDSRSFASELEKQIREELRDLTAKGLKIRNGAYHPSEFNLTLEGPDELIEEAKRRLS